MGNPTQWPFSCRKLKGSIRSKICSSTQTTISMRNASRFLRLTSESKRKKKCPTLRHKWKGIHLDLEWISNKLPERLISLSRSFQTGYNDKRIILFEENHVLRSPSFFTCT